MNFWLKGYLNDLKPESYEKRRTEMDNQKVFVVLRGRHFYINGNNNYTIKINEVKNNSFYTILSAFIQFAEEYDTIVTVASENQNCIIHTNLLDVISSASKGYSDKKIEEMIAFAYKAIKIGGFKRPNKFIFVNDGSLSTSVLSYCKSQIFESQDGDNELVDYKELSNLLDEKLNSCNDSCPI